MQDRTDKMDNVTILPTYDVEWMKNIPYYFNDLVIIIEYLAGDIREKVTSDGKTITGTMPAAYGFIARTTDAHGEEIDMYLAGLPDTTVPIYVIDQVNPGTGQFDEHKVMLGFGSLEEATHLYESVFADGSGEKRLGAITSFSLAAFHQWAGAVGTSLKAAADYKAQDVETFIMAGIEPSSKSTPLPVPRDEAGGVQVQLTDLTQGPKIKTYSDGNDVFNHHLYLYAALSMEGWSNVTDTLCRLLDLAKSTETVHLHLATPGGSVFLMGRIISAINRTKATVITYAEGQVASAGTAIFVAGHERHILPGAYFMQHMSSQLLAGKTTDIAAKSIFCVAYIERQLAVQQASGLFTPEEVYDMIEKSADIYVSGREAVARIGKVSAR